MASLSSIFALILQSIFSRRKFFLFFLDLRPTCLKSHWTPLHCSSHSKVLCLTNNKEMSKAVVSSGLIQHQDVESIFWLSLQYPTRATMFTELIRIQPLSRIESSFGTLFNSNTRNRLNASFRSSLHCPSIALQGKPKGYNCECCLLRRWCSIQSSPCAI